jgi:hypothetical protein
MDIVYNKVNIKIILSNIVKIIKFSIIKLNRTIKFKLIKIKLL